MKRHPILRILFLFLTLAAFSVAPFIVGHLARVHPVKVSQSHLPLAGQTFYIAGQDESPDPGIILRAQDTAEIGELIRLDASESEVDGITWQIIPDTPDFEVIEDGRRAFFSSRVPGEYLIIIAAAKDGIPYLEHHSLTVIGELPEPGPETVAAKVRRWAADVEPYEGKDAHQKALAGVFQKLAEADEISVDDMLEATATANTAVLGDSLDYWLPLLEPLGEELDALMEAGKLETRSDYAKVWTEISKGLEGKS